MPDDPTVYDVAARAGVSIATVSRTLRLPDAVRPETRRRVTEAAHALGYVPSGNARGLARRRTGVLGVCVVADIVGDSVDEPAQEHDGGDDSLFWDEVIRGLQQASWRRGFAVLIAVTPATRSYELTNDIAGRVDGLAVLAERVPTRELGVIARRIPVVTLAGRQEMSGVDGVRAANSKGMRRLVEHLVRDHGHRDLAVVSGPPSSPDSVARLAGMRRTLREAGLRPPTEPLFVGDFTFESGHRAAAALLDRPTMPDVVVCANDQMAIGLIRTLRAAGVRVPHDVAVTGFDGIELGAHTDPSITTVHQPMRQMGRIAVDLLAERLADPGRPATTRTLPVDVVIRSSCGCPGGSS